MPMEGVSLRRKILGVELLLIKEQNNSNKEKEMEQSSILLTFL